jgi:hypothetical protein
MKKLLMVFAVLLFFGTSAHAANGDLTVNGTLNVGSAGIKFSDGSTQTSASAANGDLTVNGTLNVGSGGIKFSDGSTQTTANRLVWDSTVTGSAVTTLTSPTLDGNADAGYEFEVWINNPTGASVTYSVYFNGDQTATNYQSFGVYGGASTASQYNNNDASLTGLGSNSETFVAGDISVSPTGRIALNARQTAGAVSNALLRGLWYKISATNLTSVKIASSATGGIGVNSRVRMWKKK